MKTLSFRELKIGRADDRVLLNLDSDRDGISLLPGIQLLMAPNGIGKTSFLLTVAGVIAPLGGRVVWDGKPLLSGKDVFYMSEFMSFPKLVTPREWISYAGGRFSAPRMGPWVKRLGVPDVDSNFMGRMSQGERRKVMWLAAHASEREIILLDEPFKGLDLLGAMATVELLIQWKKEGRLILIVTHQAEELFSICDEILLIHEKRVRRWEQLMAGPIDPAGAREKLYQLYGESRN